MPKAALMRVVGALAGTVALLAGCSLPPRGELQASTAFPAAGIADTWLARATLWGSVTSYRLDLALGMAQFLLLAWWLGQADDRLPTEAQRRAMALVLAAATGMQTAWEMSRMPLDIADRLPAGLLVLAALAAMAAVALWVARQVELRWKWPTMATSKPPPRRPTRACRPGCR